MTFAKYVHDSVVWKPSSTLSAGAGLNESLVRWPLYGLTAHEKKITEKLYKQAANSHLPQQKITKSLFTAGSDEQVRLKRSRCVQASPNQVRINVSEKNGVMTIKIRRAECLCSTQTQTMLKNDTDHWPSSKRVSPLKSSIQLQQVAREQWIVQNLLNI